MMELLCIEIETEPRGYLDPVFLDDERVLRNLLLTEERYTISSSYFKCFQTELQCYMRKVVCSWMLEVSRSFLVLIILTWLYVELSSCVTLFTLLTDSRLTLSYKSPLIKRSSLFRYSICNFRLLISSLFWNLMRRCSSSEATFLKF